VAKVPLKKPKTFDEQIELLESRGLLIEDKIKTKYKTLIIIDLQLI